ncbi:S1/P1 nuclease [uncultured Alistipes sp.]|jgi:S1/P1 nuclease|uniref:S1/P1 nuclease n=1 Tax=uncultured Alistipes sp. TaxID=538949 RepID=UPI0025E4E78A|nr:S1/P1 nuclease [uncultured Alistipes sp.]
MKKLAAILLTAVLCCCYGTALGWGKIGHDAIAYIAECNLTPKAKKNVEKCLDGKSIVYYASWMDQIRHTPPYKHTTTWHTNNVDADGRYVRDPKGDAMTFLEDCIAKIKDRKNQSDSTVTVATRFLIHLVGDMHCPVHVKYPWYNSYKFSLDGKEYGFHNFWDEWALTLSNKWYYLEYQHQLDRCSKKEKQEIAKGTPHDWLAQSARDCRVIYDWTKAGQNLSKNDTRDFVIFSHEFAEEQLLKAGYRLAALLNELFG